MRELLARGEDRVISLIGPGGIGKSRLAIEAALATEDLFPDGTYFVPLEGVLEGDLLLPTIGFALGIRDNGEAALEERISRALEGRRVLLVLDNFEQIVDVAPVLVRLYTVAPLARFLVTSRIVLRIRGERVYEVPALAFPADDEPTSIERARRSAACTLFVDRARAAKPGFELTEENAGAVADICRRLEGLPLAIELAAAKVRLLTPQGIAQRLERSLPLLTAAVRDLPERHRTMRATIDWSVSLLPDIQREMLTDLGVFATRFTIDAVEALGVGRVVGRARHRRADGARRRIAREADGYRRPLGLLAARDRAGVRARAPEGAGRRRSGARGARRLLPRPRRAGSRLGCAASARRSPSASWASSCPTSAQPSVTSSTPTASTTPATSPGACSSTGGSRACSAACGCGCWSCSARIVRSRSTPERWRGSSLSGARCGSGRRRR